MKNSYKQYKITSFIGIILRTYLISNVFEEYFDNVLIAYLINATIGEFVLWKTTYHLSVGSIYEKNSFPTGGSILYTLFYFLNNGILYLACYLCKLYNISFYYVFIIYFVILLTYVFAMKKIRHKLTCDY